MTQNVYVYRGKSYLGILELPSHSSFLTNYPEELDYDDDGRPRQWVVRLVHIIQGKIYSSGIVII